MIYLVLCFSLSVEDPKVPEPKSDPTYSGVPASKWAAILMDRDPDVIEKAARALYEIGDEAIPHIEPYLRKGSMEDREHALRPLHLMIKFKESKEAIKCWERSLDCKDNHMTCVVALISIVRLEKSAEPLMKKVEELATASIDKSNKQAKARQDVAQKVVAWYKKLEK